MSYDNRAEEVLKPRRKIAGTAALSLVATITLTQPAYAYLDPGTASIILQAVIGAIAVTGLFFRNSIATALRFLGIGKSKPAPGSDSEQADLAQKDADGT